MVKRSIIKLTKQDSCWELISHDIDRSDRDSRGGQHGLELQEGQALYFTGKEILRCLHEIRPRTESVSMGRVQTM